MRGVHLVVLGEAGEHVVALVGEALRLWRDGHAAGVVVLEAGHLGVLPIRAHLQGHLSSALHLDGEPAEDGEPDDGKECGDEEAADDDLADGAPARDEGNEEANKRCPSDPPCPVEDRPPVHKLRVGVVIVGRSDRARVAVGVAAAPRHRLAVGRLGAAGGRGGPRRSARCVGRGGHGRRAQRGADGNAGPRRGGRVGVSRVRNRAARHAGGGDVGGVEQGEVVSGVRVRARREGVRVHVGEARRAEHCCRDEALGAVVNLVAAIGGGGWYGDRRTLKHAMDGELALGAPEVVGARVHLEGKLLESLAVEADLDDILDVVAGRLRVRVAEVRRNVGGERATRWEDGVGRRGEGC